MQFNILVYDQRGKASCKNAIGLLDMFRGCAASWNLDRPMLNENAGLLEWKNWTLQVKQVSAEQEPSVNQERSFLVEANGDFNAVEPIRVRIAQYLNKVGFRPIYILRDEISEDISCRLYPYIYRLENRLREYLTRFYCTIYGADFWPVVAGKLIKKAEQFEGNEKIFTDLTDTTAYRLTFDDLGGIVFKLGATQPEIDALMELVRELNAEDQEGIQKLQKDLKPNYDRFFSALKTGDFRKKWEKFSFYRNKVAHNNLFIGDDDTQAKILFDELIKLINENETEIATLQLSIPEADRAALQDELLNSSPEEQNSLWIGPEVRFTDITTEEFLLELKEREHLYSKKPQGFVGLKRFIEFHLGALGYTYRSSWDVYQNLLEKGLIEKYEVKNKYSDYPTAAVRSKTQNS